MRTIWSALVVLVLLAPLGGVGITTTPVEAEIVASPRGPAASVAKLRIDSEHPPVLAVVPVGLVAARVPVRRTRILATPSPLLVSERYSSAGPRDPPV
jgi:hypothetical protein